MLPATSLHDFPVPLLPDTPAHGVPAPQPSLTLPPELPTDTFCNESALYINKPPLTPNSNPSSQLKGVLFTAVPSAPHYDQYTDR